MASDYERGASDMLQFLRHTLDAMEKAALRTSEDPRMGVGPLEGVRVLALNQFTRTFLKLGDVPIAMMQADPTREIRVEVSDG